MIQELVLVLDGCDGFVLAFNLFGASVFGSFAGRSHKGSKLTTPPAGSGSGCGALRPEIWGHPGHYNEAEKARAELREAMLCWGVEEMGPDQPV